MAYIFYEKIECCSNILTNLQYSIAGKLASFNVSAKIIHDFVFLEPKLRLHRYDGLNRGPSRPTHAPCNIHVILCVFYQFCCLLTQRVSSSSNHLPATYSGASKIESGLILYSTSHFLFYHFCCTIKHMLYYIKLVLIRF